MPKESQSLKIHDITISGFAYELLRDDLLNDLLGKDTDKILYWAGKNLARKYPLQTIDEIMDFFIMAGWGYLNIEKEKKSELHLSISGDLITHRFEMKKDMSYKLECGFLSQQLQQQKGVVAEGYEDQSKRKEKVFITIKWDGKDEIDA